MIFNGRILPVVLTAAILFFGSVSGRAAEENKQAPLDNLSTEVIKRAQPLINTKQVTGLAIGLIHDGQTQVIGFGRATDDKDQPPDGQTVFEIGSITKVFTGLLLADMVIKGELGLDDPVQSLLPESVSIPKWEGEPITLRHLVTHTAALPRIPPSMIVTALTNPEGFADNPYKEVTEEDVYRSISTFELKQKPGEKYTYSNFGMGLLGHALAHHNGQTYAALVQERIAAPLGMHDTRIAGDAGWTARFAAGHDGEGKPTVPWEMSALEGAGALRSTVDDMLSFMAAQLDPGSAPLAEAIKLAQQRHFTVDPERMSLGLAWHIDERRKTVWHNGQSGGFHSFMGFRPERGVGVVVLANSATSMVDKLGIEMLNLLAVDEKESKETRPKEN